jgi:Holliday junction resolvase RusA-like endonuclease
MLYLQLEQNPVPASRPRVTRWATYYTKPYERYRDNVGPTIEQALGRAKAEGILPYDSKLILAQVFEVLKPRTTKLEYPHADVDNFIKSLWDGLQKHEIILDDKHVIASTELKRWTTTTPQTHVLIRTVTSQDMNHARTANPQTLLQDMMMGMASAFHVAT